MCDFAPRMSCDWPLAILRFASATAGIITPRPVVAMSDTVMLIADPHKEFTTELGGIAAAINAETTTTPGDSRFAEAGSSSPSGVVGGNRFCACGMARDLCRDMNELHFRCPHYEPGGDGEGRT